MLDPETSTTTMSLVKKQSFGYDSFGGVGSSVVTSNVPYTCPSLVSTKTLIFLIMVSIELFAFGCCDVLILGRV